MSQTGIVILISGRGSNAQALIEAAESGLLPSAIHAVVADRPADGLARAAEHGIDTALAPRARYPNRESFERALIDVVDGYRPAWIALAGFMRVLSDSFVQRYRGRLINIHPSLLPKYRGLDTHGRALAAGDLEHGASVHWVTPALDAGPVIAQARVTIGPDDNAEVLAERVLKQEHRLYPATMALLVREAVRMPDDDEPYPEPLLLDHDLDARGQRLPG